MPLALDGFCHDTVMCVSSKARGGTTTLMGGFTAACAVAEARPMANATIGMASLIERLMVFSVLLFMGGLQALLVGRRRGERTHHRHLGQGAQAGHHPGLGTRERGAVTHGDVVEIRAGARAAEADRAG